MSFTLGYINLDLIIGAIGATILFHIVDARTSYNLLLGIPWVHKQNFVPSTYQ